MAVLIFTCLFGFLGFYRFYKKDYWTGILFICTLGVFIVGWAIDVMKAYGEYIDKKKSKSNK